MGKEYGMNVSSFKVELAFEKKLEGLPDPKPFGFNTIASDMDGALYCSDEFNHRVLVFDREWRFLFVIGKRGSAPGEFWYPRGLAVVKGAESNELVVCDSWNHRIQRFDLNGNFLGSFGSIGDGAQQFDEPMEVIPGEDDTVWILDKNNHRVSQYELDGEFLAGFGARCSRTDELLATDHLKRFFDSHFQDPRFFFPTSFSQLGNGNLLIADTNNRRLCELTLFGELKRTVKLDVENRPPYFFPKVVNVLAGDIVVVGDINNFYRIIDWQKPWVDQVVKPGGGNEKDILKTRIENGPPRVAFFDRKLEKLELRAVEVKSDSALSFPDTPFPDENEFAKIPNEWTETEQAKWHSYLKSTSPDNTNGQPVQFLETCLLAAKHAAGNVVNTETLISQHLAKYTGLLEKQEMGAAPGETVSEISSQIAWEHVKFTRLSQERALYRAMLIETLNMAGEILVLYKGRDEIGPICKQFISDLEGELNDCEKNYKEVSSWLKDRIDNVAALDKSAATFAFSALLFSMEQADIAVSFLRMVKKRGYGSNMDHDSFLGHELKNCSQELLTICYLVHFFIFNCSLMWKDAKTATVSCRAALDRSESPGMKAHLLIQLFDLLNKSGANTGELLDTLQQLPAEFDDPPVLLEFAFRFQACGEFERAEKIVDRVKREGGEVNADMLKIIEKRFEALLDVKTPSLHLHENETAGDACLKAGLAPPPVGSNLKYVRSLSIINPATGDIVQPFRSQPVTKNRLAVATKDGKLFLVTDDETHTLLYHAEDEVITSGLEVSDQEEVVLLFRSPAESQDFIRMVSVSVSTGAARDVSDDYSHAPGSSPWRLAQTDDGALVILDVGANEPGIRIVDVGSGVKERTSFALPALGRISDIACRGESIAIACRDKYAVYRVNVDGADGRFIEPSQIAVSGVAVDKNELIYSTGIRDIGIEVFDKHGRRQYSVVSVKGNSDRRFLQSGKLSLGQVPFMDGDLFHTDPVNNKINIFRL